MADANICIGGICATARALYTVLAERTLFTSTRGRKARRCGLTGTSIRGTTSSGATADARQTKESICGKPMYQSAFAASQTRFHPRTDQRCRGKRGGEEGHGCSGRRRDREARARRAPEAVMVVAHLRRGGRDARLRQLSSRQRENHRRRRARSRSCRARPSPRHSKQHGRSPGAEGVDRAPAQKEWERHMVVAHGCGEGSGGAVAVARRASAPSLAAFMLVR